MRIDLVHLGRASYRAADDAQMRRQVSIEKGRKGSALFIVELLPVITLGSSFKWKDSGYEADNLRLSPDEYREHGIRIEPSSRGGDVTYHGPGQLVAYPVFDLRQFGQDLHRWLRDLEEVFIRAIAEFGLEGRRFPPHTGVWVGDAKIAAIGVHVRKWISTHGVALNCDNDLEPFETIVPCGIQGYGVTSLSKLLGRKVSTKEAEPAVLRGFESVFGVSFV